MQKPYQFTADDADIILRTPDRKIFRVHKNILSIASTVFRDMLAVSHPPPKPTTGVESDLSVIDVHDSAQDLETLLRMIYPVAPPTITDLDALSKTFVILDKYHIEGLQERLKPLLVSPAFLTTDPVRVYAIACRWDFKTEAAIAAPYASAVGISAFTCTDDIKHISGLDYHRMALLAVERREICRGEILNKPTTCERCPLNFYEELRPRILQRLFAGNEMLRDLASCMEECFDALRETEIKGGRGGCPIGIFHREQFVISLAKSMQSMPTSGQNTTA